MANEMIEPQAIQPQSAAPAAPAEPAAPEEGGGGASLPDEVIQQPVMQALMAGSPPATSADLQQAQDSEFGQLVSKHAGVLRQAGFGLYRSQDGTKGVLFNGLRINPQEIQQADQQGQLLQVAPPIEQVEQMIASNPEQNPVLSAEAPAGAAIPPVPQGGAPAGGGPAMSGKVAQALFSARKKNLTPGGPTSGPKPGGGRVANAILKNVV